MLDVDIKKKTQTHKLIKLAVDLSAGNLVGKGFVTKLKASKSCLTRIRTKAFLFVQHCLFLRCCLYASTAPDLNILITLLILSNWINLVRFLFEQLALQILSPVSLKYPQCNFWLLSCHKEDLQPKSMCLYL